MSVVSTIATIPPSDRPRLVAGRRALVTGGSRGLGRGVALGLAEAGANVAIVYRTRGAEAAAVAELCTAHGGRSVCVQADVGDSDQASAAVAEAAGLFGGLDIVVANAGIGNPYLTL